MPENNKTMDSKQQLQALFNLNIKTTAMFEFNWRIDQLCCADKHSRPWHGDVGKRSFRNWHNAYGMGLLQEIKHQKEKRYRAGEFVCNRAFPTRGQQSG